MRIPAGLATADEQVITRVDNLTEQNLIVCRLATGTTYIAKDVGGNLSPLSPGSAYGANLENQVVGEIYVYYFTGWNGNVAFRSKSGANVQGMDLNIVNGVGDVLRAPGTSGGQNLVARALSVNRSGRAVGRYEIAGEKLATSWSPAALASDASAIDLQAWKARVGSTQDNQSTANSINNLGWIVGWSSIDSTPARAVIKWAATGVATDWIDLNDSHFVSGTAGWVLENANAISDSGHIVGNGTVSGAPRAFVLVPRIMGN